jgi:hypothetical protein
MALLLLALASAELGSVSVADGVPVLLVRGETIVFFIL